MGYTIYSGNSQLPGDFDSSRITPQIREQLGNLTPELAKGIRNVADAPPTPNRTDRSNNR